jgi:hypothetical protein
MHAPYVQYIELFAPEANKNPVALVGHKETGRIEESFNYPEL